jgi:K+-sensing histidine kinase KdpD
MDKTILEIPTELLEAARLTADEAKTELAIRLYQQHKLNEEQARALAGDPKAIEELVWGSHATGQIDMNGFLSWASHDLKSPLNAIIGFTRVVIKGMDGPVTPEQSADLTTAFTSGQRMLFFVNSLVDMARLNIGQINLKRAETDIAALLKETVERWQIANPTKKAGVALNISAPMFAVDSVYMKQAVTFLLSYAAMRVTEGDLTFSAQDDENGLRVTVQSAGKKSRDKFEMDSAMYDFVCASLIKLHGGKMDEPQETEDGLLLTFSLPR